MRNRARKTPYSAKKKKKRKKKRNQPNQNPNINFTRYSYPPNLRSVDRSPMAVRRTKSGMVFDASDSGIPCSISMHCKANLKATAAGCRSATTVFSIPVSLSTPRSKWMQAGSRSCIFPAFKQRKQTRTSNGEPGKAQTFRNRVEAGSCNRVTLFCKLMHPAELWRVRNTVDV